MIQQRWDFYCYNSVHFYIINMDTSRIDELHKPLNTLYRDESDLQMMVVEQVDNLDDFFQSMYRFYGMSLESQTFFFRFLRATSFLTSNDMYLLVGTILYD